MSTETNAETCSKRVWDKYSFTSRPCGRPVKGEGLCGIHLRQKTERERKDREAIEKYDADRKARIELQSRLNNLGLEGDPRIHIAEQKRISVTIDELERIVNGK